MAERQSFLLDVVIKFLLMTLQYIIPPLLTALLLNWIFQIEILHIFWVSVGVLFLFTFIGVQEINKYSTSFSTSIAHIIGYTLFASMSTILLTILSWVVATYLITSISHFTCILIFAICFGGGLFTEHIADITSPTNSTQDAVNYLGIEETSDGEPVVIKLSSEEIIDIISKRE